MKLAGMVRIDLRPSEYPVVAIETPHRPIGEPYGRAKGFSAFTPYLGCPPLGAEIDKLVQRLKGRIRIDLEESEERSFPIGGRVGLAVIDRAIAFNAVLGAGLGAAVVAAMCGGRVC
jgi:hypothetical protein